MFNIKKTFLLFIHYIQYKILLKAAAIKSEYVITVLIEDQYDIVIVT